MLTRPGRARRNREWRRTPERNRAIGAPERKMNMRLLLLLGLLLFGGFYVLGAALIARAWWLSGRTSPSGEPKSPSHASEATRTRAA